MQHDTLQPRRVNTLNVLARCHFGGLNDTYTYMLFGQVEFNLAKSKPFPIFVKLRFFLSQNFCPEGTFSTQVYPSSFNLEKLG
jgi:hypothetical protein